MTFTKAHAYGNDFLYVLKRDVTGVALDALARELCERHTGAGADGLIEYEAVDGALSPADFNRIYRPFLQALAGRLRDNVQGLSGRLSEEPSAFWSEMILRLISARQSTFWPLAVVSSLTPAAFRPRVAKL